MPRQINPKKDVAGCEKPRRVTKQTMTRGYPNGETHSLEYHTPKCFAIKCMKGSRRTEISK